MKNADIRKVIDDAYDESREGSIRSMVSEFYSRRMFWTALYIWVIALAFLIGAVFSAVRFFDAAETRNQILYATLFLTFVYLLGLMKIFAWQMVHRNSIAREIKRLELRIGELADARKKEI
jgi:hypothetical protein